MHPPEREYFKVSCLVQITKIFKQYSSNYIATKSFVNFFRLNKYLINDGQNVFQSFFDAVRYLVLSREHSSPFKKRNKIQKAVNDKKTKLCI